MKILHIITLILGGIFVILGLILLFYSHAPLEVSLTTIGVGAVAIIAILYEQGRLNKHIFDRL